MSRFGDYGEAVDVVQPEAGVDRGVKGTIFNIMRYSVEDGPNVRTTVFLKGCPLRCRWCHNPESRSGRKELVFRAERCIACGECVKACPQEAIVEADGGLRTLTERCDLCGKCIEVCCSEARYIIGREVTVDEVMPEIRKDIPFYEESGGGVTFSGGEPLMQPEFLEELLKACKAEEIHTAVDTCGAADFEIFKLIAPFVDLYLYDLKLLDDVRHERETGISNTRILGNLSKLCETDAKVTIRIPIIPDINDDDGNISALGSYISTLASVPDIQILPFHEAGMEKFRLLEIECDMPPIKPPSREQLEKIADKLRRFGLRVSAGG